MFPIASKIKTALGAIGQIDFIFAKAKYSKKINGICPLINDKKEIINDIMDGNYTNGGFLSSLSSEEITELFN